MSKECDWDPGKKEEKRMTTSCWIWLTEDGRQKHQQGMNGLEGEKPNKPKTES